MSLGKSGNAVIGFMPLPPPLLFSVRDSSVALFLQISRLTCTVLSLQYRSLSSWTNICLASSCLDIFCHHHTSCQAVREILKTAKIFRQGLHDIQAPRGRHTNLLTASMRLRISVSGSAATIRVPDSSALLDSTSRTPSTCRSPPTLSIKSHCIADGDTSPCCNNNLKRCLTSSVITH